MAWVCRRDLSLVAGFSVPRSSHSSKALKPVKEMGRLILDVEQVRRELLRQIAIVGDKQNRAGIVDQRSSRELPVMRYPGGS